MKYIIMADGEGKRWNDHLGIPKHLVEIGGETLLERTTRLLRENGVQDYIITCSDERYSQYGLTMRQTVRDCEIDRFEESIVDGPVCYLYGDTYYTDNAIKTIVNAKIKDYMFFGHRYEIFAIKITSPSIFFDAKKKVKELYQENIITRCIGWEVYRHLEHIPYDCHIIKEDGKYCLIEDGTDDIDYPADYEAFKKEKEKITK